MNKHARHLFTFSVILGVLAFIVIFLLTYYGYMPERFTAEQMAQFGSVSAFALYVFLFCFLLYAILIFILFLRRKKLGETKVKSIRYELTKYIRAIVMICFALTMTSVDVPLYIWIPAVILSLLFGVDSIIG